MLLLGNNVHIKNCAGLKHLYDAAFKELARNHARELIVSHIDTNPVSPGRRQNRQITGFQLAGRIPPASDLFDAEVFGVSEKPMQAVDRINRCEFATAYVCGSADVASMRKTLRPVKPGVMKKAAPFDAALGINFLGLALDSDLPTSMASAIGSFDPSVRTSRVQAGAESIVRKNQMVVNSGIVAS